MSLSVAIQHLQSGIDLCFHIECIVELVSTSACCEAKQSNGHYLHIMPFKLEIYEGI